MAPSIDDFVFLWDGSEPGWILLKLSGAESSYVVFNTESRVAMNFDDAEAHAAVTARMIERGCQVRTLGEDDRFLSQEWFPSSD